MTTASIHRGVSKARRVVVTGMGLVSPLGVGVSRVWERLVEGKASGLRSLRREDDPPSHLAPLNGLPCTVAACVPRGPRSEGGFLASEYLDSGEERRLALFTQYALAAAHEALEDAQYRPRSDEARERMGVCVGSGIGSLEDTVDEMDRQLRTAYRRISPMYIPRILTNMAAGHLSIRHGLWGPNHAVATACTTGLHAIGDACRFIQEGDADVMLAGGTEACISPIAIAGFSRAKALATSFNDNPQGASRPFDSRREGFIMGEGAGILVLEEAGHARERGAKIYGEIVGYGLSGDAHHMTAPSEDGRGALLAMSRALGHAGIPPTQVDYINAHATSTPLGDTAENRAILRLVGGGRGKELAISSTKGAIGHLLGAAGAVETIFTLLALSTDKAPPTKNLDRLHAEEEDEGAYPFDYIRDQGQSRPVEIALTNSFGFGGTNASLCMRKWRDER
ncbi:3-oxoacyl-synthase [Piptocephalis cylindrospora]|uniref:3-oxoacyl-[acyl-carrier-protein] synthase n=1 Tax=Piptocephalis cylindrospora TaxID=1907219 RepID=A0A4P9Y0I8_9FUNG|nr:3-oxoacyl-synthase [Piptocephalis cylindrospora]|eukprot:RKP11541.1 3-oxoacyl-synthase [Piptocephalis cylindrospora]